MLYLRLWLRFVRMSIVRLTEYRFNCLVSIGFGVAELAVSMFTLDVMYHFAPVVAGWSQAQILILVGIYRFVDGLISLQIAPNLRSISGYIRRGDMDFILLRPVSSRFLVSLRLIELPAAINALIGLSVTVYALNLSHTPWNVIGISMACIFLVCGLLLLYCVWLFLATFSFWLIDVDALDTLFYSIFETARYPVTFFSGFVRTVLIFAVPVAFATTFPTQALLGTVDERMLWVGLTLAMLAFIGTHIFWTFAIRHYTSASS